VEESGRSPWSEIKKTGGPNPVWFLKFWFLIAEIPLYTASQTISLESTAPPEKTPLPRTLH